MSKKSEIKEVKLPKTVQPRLEGYIAQVEIAKGNLGRYLQGICDSLGLEGQWDLDAKRMMATKVEEKPSGEE